MPVDLLMCEPNALLGWTDRNGFAPTTEIKRSQIDLISEDAEQEIIFTIETSMRRRPQQRRWRKSIPAQLAVKKNQTRCTRES